MGISLITLLNVFIVFVLTRGQRNVNNGIVSSPVVDFACGRRGFIPIVFGFGSPAALRTPLMFRKKRASTRMSPTLLKLDEVYEPSVVGGHESFQNSWPWMALLGTKVGGRNQFFCSGVVINKRFILTAAHCTGEYDKFFIRLGEHNYIDGTATAEDFEVSEILLHPEYRSDRGYNDIALVKLSKNIKFSKAIKPICLPWGAKSKENLINKQVIVTGWGTTAFGGSLSGSLQEVKIKVFNARKCHTSYSALRDFKRTFPSGMTAQNIICAGDHEGGKDACQGDSGGPIMKEERNGQYTMIGVVSKGYGCGNKNFPGLYAPLGNYKTLNWIKKTAF